MKSREKRYNSENIFLRKTFSFLFYKGFFRNLPSELINVETLIHERMVNVVANFERRVNVVTNSRHVSTW